MRRYGEAQARLEHAGGYDWRERATAVRARARLRGRRISTAASRRSRAASSRAPRSPARSAATPTCCCSTSRRTTSTSRASSGSSASCSRSTPAIILVAHDRWFLEAVTNGVLELDAGRVDVLPRPVARVAAREGRAPARRAEGGRPRRPRHRAARALRRALPRIKKKKARKAQVEADADRPARKGTRRSRRPRSTLLTRTQPHSRLRVPEARAQRPHRVEAERPRRSASASACCCEDATFAIERGEHVALVGPNGSGKTTLLETILERREPTAARSARPRRRGCVLLAAGARARHARLGAAVRAARDGPPTPRRAEAPRPVPLLRLGPSTRSRSSRFREASGGGWRSRSWSRPARTS